jgi:hypothetical protein
MMAILQDSSAGKNHHYFLHILTSCKPFVIASRLSKKAGLIYSGPVQGRFATQMSQGQP